MGLGKLGKKNEIEPLSYIIHKNKLKMNWKPKEKTWNHKILRRKFMGKYPWY